MFNHMERWSCAKELVVIVGLHQIAIVPHSLHGRHQVVCKPLPTKPSCTLTWKSEKKSTSSSNEQKSKILPFKVINKWKTFLDGFRNIQPFRSLHRSLPVHKYWLYSCHGNRMGLFWAVFYSRYTQRFIACYFITSFVKVMLVLCVHICSSAMVCYLTLLGTCHQNNNKLPDLM